MSPMITHYLQIKEKYKDAIVFYRLGDFYEMFFEDAIEMSKALELTLTGKDCGMAERAPMCGVPVKAMDIYLAKAIEKGYKVAVCEQLSEPTNNGEIVQRDVVRVITAGTIMEDGILDEKKNNYILSIYKDGEQFGLAWIDLTTGEFNVGEIAGEDAWYKLNDMLIMISPSEIIANSEMRGTEEKIQSFKFQEVVKPQIYHDWAYDFSRSLSKLKTQLGTVSLKSFGIEDKRLIISASGGLLEYLKETQKRALSHINSVRITHSSDYMQLDSQTRKNLELVKSSRDGGKRGTVLWLLDNTSTNMGGRLLRKFVEQPLQNVKEINLRLSGVEELYKNLIKREAIREQLNKFADIERICGKISYGTVSPKECVALVSSLQKLPAIKTLLESMTSKAVQEILNNIDVEEETTELLKRAISEDAPSLVKEGGVFKEGYNSELDDLRNAKSNGITWLAELEAEEKEQTGIKNLKIGYNRIFGYFIEITNSQKELVPFRYQRKQTLSNCERYITPELKELEEKIIGSEEKAVGLEQKLFEEIKEFLLTKVKSMQNTASHIAYLDALCSLATVAIKNNYTKPKIVGESEELLIQDGRHPIVELLNREQFVPNDTLLNTTDSRTMIITGPNMAGKSTYMRQVAVIVLLAHIGSFVPAKSAQIPITDRIFTRIGASDDLAYGQSTFMVEMIEVANILHSATGKSLIILDEVGRGTSTFDGLSIAWSVMEYVSNHLSAKTLFSTHYHELTELEGLLDGVKNYRISVKEFNGTIIFLRKIVRGGANKSFGIEVAGLAGLPKKIIDRAKEILKTLEEADVNRNVGLTNSEETDRVKESKTNNAEIVNMLKEIDVNRLSPMEAFSIVTDLIDKIKKEK